MGPRLPYSGSEMGAGHPDEPRLFWERWSLYVNHEPANSPNLACGVSWPFPAFPPRIDRPWR